MKGRPGRNDRMLNDLSRTGGQTVICCRTPQSSSADLAAVCRPARGFTLLEVLIVLGVLAALAALSWPALRGQLETAHLRNGAKQLRDELLRTRHRAVETGRPHRFRYAWGQRQFEILPTSFASYGSPAGASRAESPLSARDTSENGFADTDDDVPAGRVAQHELPEGVFFVDPFESPSRLSQRDVEASLETPPSAGPDDPSPETRQTGAVVNTARSQSVVFYPNGRTNNAQLRLMNQRGAWIDIRLRGLTGTATLGPVERREVER